MQVYFCAMSLRSKLLMVLTATCISTPSFAQKSPAQDKECVDIIYTRGGRILNCRIDAVSGSDLYFSNSSRSPYSDKFLPKDSLRAVWPLSKRSRELLRDKSDIPVELTPPPPEYRNPSAGPDITTVRSVNTLFEFSLAYSHMLGSNEATGSAGAPIEELRDAPQYTLRFGIASKSGFGGYLWGDARSSSASDAQYSFKYTYTNFGAGLLLLTPFSRKKDVGYVTTYLGLGYGGVEATARRSGSTGSTLSGGGLLMDLGLGLSMTIAKTLQLGIDSGLQRGTASLTNYGFTFKEDLGRIRLGGKVGIVF